ncbi:hypothetical protein F5051DRAFT_444973 [Lentinula edodes]|nr:hypothetical protein F5051DRAFT_444973 [Lentinula edodes]
MSTSQTTTTTQPAASTSSRPANPPSPGAPIDEDEDEIIREALARVERVKARKAAEVAKKKAAEEAAARKVAEEAEKKERAAAQVAAARRQAAQDARDRAIWAREQEDGIVERRVRQSEVKGGTPRGMFLRKAKAQPVGEDPDDGDDGDDGDDDNEDQEPCEQCRSKKIPCLQQAGKRSSVICKPCHDSKDGLDGIVEESEEEEEVEEKEKEMEKDGEGEEEEMGEAEMAPTEAQSKKGKERAE